ncbi:DNA primase [Patescibacteria group bacterium]|nr:DNA primase [Patescibacteria group bacterium]
MDGASEIRSRLAIEDVIGEYVQLKRAGRNYRGLSPFTSEKTPSFMVSPEKQIWHDFSSGKGGNMFSFIMEIEGLDFKGALELLARKAGVDLDKYRSGGRNQGPSRERLLAANAAAVKFYQVQLAANTAALNYAVHERKLSKATLLLWRIGYAPNTGTALINYLKKQGFADQEMRQAGLISGRGSTSYDMFRSRLMIPLMDPQGQVVGFTARALSIKDKGPKYINTPQTQLYDKSRHVFGLHLAKQAIRSGGFAVIVEGNLDVIMSHQVGVNQVVATAGTALTQAHLKSLNNFTSDIRLCFDADRAGLSATERAIGLASKLHLSLNIIDLVDGKDPDELIKKDPASWRSAINNYQYGVDWFIERLSERYDIKSANGKRQFSDVALPLIGSLDDAVERDHYLNKLSKMLDVSRSSLEDKAGRSNQPSRFLKKSKINPVVTDRQQIELVKNEDHLLALAIKHKSIRQGLLSMKVDMFNRDPAKALFKTLKDHPDSSIPKLTSLDEVTDYVKILLLQYEELYQDLELSELNYEAKRLHTRLVEAYVKQQKNRIAIKLADANEEQTSRLLTEASRLDNLLKTNLEEKEVNA